MATIPDSVKAQLVADWTGAGGAAPTYYVEEDFRVNPPLGQDAVWILSSTLDTDPVPFNDTFVTEKHVLEMVVNTLTSEDRLKELGDEVVRILNATAITDITYQRLKRRKITSGVDKGTFNYQEVITYDLQQQMKSSAAAYGAGTTGDFAVVGELTVSTYNILDALMLGSANAAWVPCSFETQTNTDFQAKNLGTITNTGAASPAYCHWALPLPTVKGSLKLYVAGTKIGLDDADAAAYIDNTYVKGIVALSTTNINTDATNKNSAAEFEDTWVAVDASVYDMVRVMLGCEVDVADELDISFVSVKCYYA